VTSQSQSPEGFLPPDDVAECMFGVSEKRKNRKKLEPNSTEMLTTKMILGGKEQGRREWWRSEIVVCEMGRV
jgi:hypothetical protein